MIYYVVGLLDKSSYKDIEKIQKFLSDKYNLYTSLPVLHVTLEVVNHPDLEKLSAALTAILQNQSRFLADINGAICFEPPYKSVNLKINKNGPINELVQKLNTELDKLGFNVRKNIENWDLHISIANTNFSERTWSKKEFQTACTLLHSINVKQQFEINTIQLWKPVNNKEEMVIESFELKDS